MQTQIRCQVLPQNAASHQDLHCLHTVISIRNKIKMKKYTRHPLNEKWTCPVNKDGQKKVKIHVFNKFCKNLLCIFIFVAINF